SMQSPGPSVQPITKATQSAQLYVGKEVRALIPSRASGAEWKVSDRVRASAQPRSPIPWSLWLYSAGRQQDSQSQGYRRVYGIFNRRIRQPPRKITGILHARH